MFNRPGFSAAKGGNLLSDWSRSDSYFQDILAADFATLRARSRELWRNDGFARGWFARQIRNVVGHEGIQLKPKVKFQNGKLDKKVNARIEEAWDNWTKAENCTVDGKLTFREVQALVVEHVLRDGEAIIRKVMHDGQFKLQIIDPDRLDEQHEDGHRTRLGIEADDWGKPVTYWFKQDINRPGSKSREYVQTPVGAADILHIFKSHYAGQPRGIPWLHAAMADSHHLKKYRESELVSARLSSNKTMFVTMSENSLELNEYDDGERPTEVSTPGSIRYLRPGESVFPFDVKTQQGAFQAYEKAVLRGMAASVGSSYPSFGNDLEGVNYSSIRQGILDERENYLELQGFLRDHFLNPIYQRWAATSYLLGDLVIPRRGIEALDAVEWRPRGWAWVDPQKEIQAEVAALDAGLTSRSAILAKTGRDYGGVLTQLKEELEMQAELNIEPKSAEKSKDDEE